MARKQDWRPRGALETWVGLPTPWGPSQARERLAPGIDFYSTAGHGGILLSPERNAAVPDYMRHPDRWYEEDIDWAIVATVFPEAMNAEGQRTAKDTLRNWRPDLYERHYLHVLGPGESHVKDERAFLELHRDDWIVTAAFGDWKEGVPPGMVAVVARKGGHRSRGPEKWFLVPEEEYRSVPLTEFVVDPGRHAEIAPLR